MKSITLEFVQNHRVDGHFDVDEKTVKLADEMSDYNRVIVSPKRRKGYYFIIYNLKNPT